MSMRAGDETVQEGTMARAIFEALESLVDPTASGTEARKRAAAAIAQGIVQHIKQHAEVVVPSNGIDVGLPSVDRTFGIS